MNQFHKTQLAILKEFLNAFNEFVNAFNEYQKLSEDNDSGFLMDEQIEIMNECKEKLELVSMGLGYRDLLAKLDSDIITPPSIIVPGV